MLSTSDDAEVRSFQAAPSYTLRSKSSAVNSSSLPELQENLNNLQILRSNHLDSSPPVSNNESRSAEMRLRRELKSVQDSNKQLELKLIKEKNLNIKLQKEILKLKAENQNIQKNLNYCSNLFTEFKKEINITSHKDKYKQAIMVSIIKFNLKKRAPTKKLSFYSYHYKKNYLYPGTNLELKKSLLKKEVVKHIKNFYEQDENSTPGPGIRDFVTKNSIKMRKRYLSDTISNLYKKFCASSNLKVSKTTFYSLKPFYVIHQKSDAQNTCKCKNHENFKFMLEKLFQLHIVSTKNYLDFIERNCCDISNENCMFGKCNKCT